MSTKLKAGTATSGAVIDADTTGILELQSGSTPTTAITVDASQNVGIGTASPTVKLQINGTSAQAPVELISSAQTGTTVRSNSVFRLQSEASGRDVYMQFSDNVANATEIGMISGNQYFCTAGTERMRIDSSGNLLVGTTSATAGGVTVRTHIAGNEYGLGISVPASGAQQNIRFVNGTTAVGSVTTTGSATAYNTSSDYRLKEDITPMTGALSKVSALKPVTYKWKSDGSYGEGFIAHELAEIVPDCVNGEKDAVDAEGNPVYQLSLIHI